MSQAKVQAQASTKEPEETGAGKLVWSASRLKKYLACPLQYRFSYVDSIPGIPTAPLILGRTLHEIILALHEDQMVEGQLPNVDQVLSWFDGTWSDALETERPLFREGAPDAEGCQRSGREMLRLYHGQQAQATPPLLVELAFEIHLEDFILCGLVDRVDEGEGGLIVTDYKSGRKAPAAQVESDWQLGIYAYAVEKIFEEPVAQVVWHYLKDGSSQSGSRSEQNYRELTQELLPHLTHKVERGEFDPNPGYWCRWCDYRQWCPAHTARARLGPPGRQS